MIAIAESGSTKCEWVILDQDGNTFKNFKTIGFNPDFHSSSFVAECLKSDENVISVKDRVNQVFFYGASCSSKSLNKIIADGLKVVYTKAEIEVDHDLLAAAYSLFEGEPLISCILGTGSNSGFFDGEKVIESIPALGFILGDEGGGGYFGKKFFSDFFYNRLPANIQNDFWQTYGLSWDIARKKIYGNIHANVYLASFMPFIANYKEDEYVINMIREGMAKFVDIHVQCFSQFKNYKVGFVGTIADVFKDILIEELQKKGFQAGKIIRSPINELVDYHLKHKDLKFTKVKIDLDSNSDSVHHLNGFK